MVNQVDFHLPDFCLMPSDFFQFLFDVLLEIFQGGLPIFELYQ